MNLKKGIKGLTLEEQKNMDSERLKNMPERHFFSDYDYEALNGYLDDAIEHKKFEKYFSGGVNFFGVDNLLDIKDEQFFAFSNHKSHMDYLLAGRLFLENVDKERFPHIVAGRSLDLPLLPFIIGFDYKKANVCWFDRSSKKPCYINEWSNRVKKRLENEESFMVYPQGTRTFDEEKSGHKFKGRGIAKTILDANCDPLILPIAVDYDKIIESSQKEGIYNAREKMRMASAGIMGKVRRTAAKIEYYARDTYAYLDRGYDKDSGAAYLFVGEPRRVSQIISQGGGDITSLTDFVQDSINDLFSDLRKRMDVLEYR